MSSTAPEVVEVPAAASKRIDLDAARAARREAKGPAGGEVPVVVLEGEEFPLPLELPVGALTAFGALFAVAGGAEGEEEKRVNLEALGSLEEAASSLFGDAWPKLKAKHLSFDDLSVLLEGALGAYGIDLPN